MVMTVCPPGEWRLSLDPDPRDAVQTAIRHGRCDLFYGRHYLRFTRRRAGDGSLSLRLEQRAVVAVTGDGLTLVAGERLTARFVYTEPDAVQAAARPFFARAAGLLDEADRLAGRPPVPRRRRLVAAVGARPSAGATPAPSDPRQASAGARRPTHTTAQG